MGVLCTICIHPQRRQIDAELLRHDAGVRVVAGRYGLEKSSVDRHLHTHLAALVQTTKEAQMLASSESLIAEMNRLHAYVTHVLERGAQTGDDRLILSGVAQGTRNVEVLARLGPVGEIEQRLKALEDQKAGNTP